MIGVPVARIAGIEVRVQLGWILVVALVSALAVSQVSAAAPGLPGAAQWLLGLIVGVGFFLSAMVHDLAHGLVAKRRGIAVPSLLISFFGGTSPMDPASSVSSDDLAIALSGPLVSTALGLVLAAIAGLVGTGGPALILAVGQLIAVLAVLNLMLGLVNFVPSYPMDGGRIVRALAWRRSGSVNAGTLASATVGRITGGVVLVGGTAAVLVGETSNGLMVILSGWFLILSSRAMRERVKVETLIGGMAVGEVMERDVSTVHANLTVDTIAARLLDGEDPISAVPVVDGDVVAGMIGVAQIRKLRPARRAEARVGEVMIRPPRMPILKLDQSLISAIEELQRAGLDGAPVISDDKLVGVLTRRSIGAAVAARREAGNPGSGSTP